MMGAPAREQPGLQVVRVFCTEEGTGGNPLGVFLDGGAVADEERQPIAHELGFSETAFVDDRERGELRIFTPMMELPLAGHPLVGTAWLLRREGQEPEALRPPAGEVGVRFAGEVACINARPEWGPPWQFDELAAPAEVDALVAGEQANEQVRWAWIDAEAGVLRMRAFARDDGILEDEATGSAALQLTAALGREIEIRQGEGSVLHARPLGEGRAEVCGRVVLDPDAR